MRKTYCNIVLILLLYVSLCLVVREHLTNESCISQCFSSEVAELNPDSEGLSELANNQVALLLEETNSNKTKEHKVNVPFIVPTDLNSEQLFKKTTLPIIPDTSNNSISDLLSLQPCFNCTKSQKIQGFKFSPLRL